MKKAYILSIILLTATQLCAIKPTQVVSGPLAAMIAGTIVRSIGYAVGSAVIIAPVNAPIAPYALALSPLYIAKVEFATAAATAAGMACPYLP